MTLEACQGLGWGDEPDWGNVARSSLEAFRHARRFVFDATLALSATTPGKRITQAHREHLYQKLILAGFSHAQVSVLVGVMALVAAFLATLTVWRPERGLWFFVVALVMLLGLAIFVMRTSARIPERVEN